MSFPEFGEGDRFPELSQRSGSRAPSVVILSHQGRAGPAETPTGCVHHRPHLPFSLVVSVLLVLDSVPSRWSSGWDPVLEGTEAGQSGRGRLTRAHRGEFAEPSLRAELLPDVPQLPVWTTGFGGPFRSHFPSAVLLPPSISSQRDFDSHSGLGLSSVPPSLAF